MFMIAPVAHAQVYSIAEPRIRSKYVYAPADSKVESPIATLTKIYKSGDSIKFETEALNLLEAAAGQDTALKAVLGTSSSTYYGIVWTSAGSDGKPVVNRVLVRRGAAPWYSTRLLGVTRAGRERLPSETAVLDVLLSADLSAELHSIWVFTPLPDPVLAQIPAVIDKINPLGVLAKAAGLANEPRSILIAVSEPAMLLAPAKIQVRDVVGTYSTAGQLALAVEEAEASVRFRQARTSPCARALVTLTRERVDEAADGAKCAAAEKDRTLCGAAILEAVKGSVAALEASPSAGICRNEQAWGPGFDPISATEQEFLKVVANGGTAKVTGETSLTNVPLRRYTFGVMTGLMVGRPSMNEPRVKVEGGKIVNAPIERAMTMVIVNLHPRAYDSDWPRLTGAERFRFFGGAVLTPDFGLTAGAGIGIMRGLSLNVGGVLLLSNTLKDGEAIDAPPVNSNDPFKAGRSVAGVVGLSYAFK